MATRTYADDTRMRTVDRLSLAAGGLLVTAFCAALAFGPSKPDPVLDAPSRVADARPAPAPAEPRTATGSGSGAPACSAVDTSAGRITCRTPSATLTIANGSSPIVFDDLQVRALRTTPAPSGLTVRLRIRNNTGLVRRIGPRQLYLSIGGQRIYPARQRSLVGKLPIRAGVTATARFALPPAAARAKTLDLAVVPFSQMGRKAPTQYGVIRLATGR